MNYTSNYNLKKPESTDFYNIGNENDNMDAIDAKLKEHSDSIGNLKNPAYTVSESLTELTSGELFSIAFGKIKKAVKSLIDHIANKNNPHSVTASQVGAASSTHSHSQSDVTGLSTALNGKASSSHSHSATDITSGTLSADRLPVATGSVVGGIKVGERLSILDGTLSADSEIYTLEINSSVAANSSTQYVIDIPGFNFNNFIIVRGISGSSSTLTLLTPTGFSCVDNSQTPFTVTINDNGTINIQHSGSSMSYILKTYLFIKKKSVNLTKLG